MKIYFDIETATKINPFNDDNELIVRENKLFKLWCDRVAKDEEPIEFYKNKWPIYAEYWQVVCVSLGVEKSDWTLKMVSFYQNADTNEKTLLLELKKVLDNEKMSKWTLVWHNIISFDIPYLVKRFIVNWISLPKILQIGWKKPWEVDVCDTLAMWKFTWVMWASLELICFLLGVPTPKDSIDWSKVNLAFWDWEYEKIKEYCEKDVEATYMVYKKLLDCNINYGQN